MKDVRLFYASKVASHFDPADLDDILETARERNRRDNITGVLFFTTDFFLQCLEGSRKVVNDLYNELVTDSRHTDLVLLSYDDIDDRMFSDWEMAYIEPNEISQEILKKHSTGQSFDPYKIDEDMANAMLVLLVQHLERS